MEPFFPELHPNPGWREVCKSHDTENLPTISSQNIGRHCILELYQCDNARLNDEAFIRTTITSSAKIAGATLINLVIHSFNPHGVTGLALLAELELIKMLYGKSPILLLDDVLAELDPKRQLLLLEAVGQKHQCLISATHVESFEGEWVRNSQLLQLDSFG